MKTLKKSLAVPALLAASALAALAQVNITTWQVNNQHTGANLNETILTPAIVSSPGSFGLLFEQSMDGQCYGQPLIVSALNIGGTNHNVVYCATQRGQVYAFDSDNNVGPNASALWTRNLIPSGAVAVPQPEVFSGDISDKLSITATPVIDLASQTIYVLVKYKITSSGAFQQRLHALDLKTGADKFGGPVNVNPTFPGTASDSSGSVIPFHQLEAHGRPALTLSNGVVYLMYSSHSDHTPYHGEIVGYDADTLAWLPSRTWIATPNAMQAGIWMGGASAAVDSAGNMFVSTGNGAWNQTNPTYPNWGESIVKLPPSGTFNVSFSNPLNWFTPNNWATLNGNDADLGSGGILLLPDQTGPHPHLLVTGGKGGTLYVVDRDSMGGMHSPNNSVQETTEANSIFVTPAYFNGNIYYAAGGNKMTQRPVSYNAATGTYLGTAIKSTFTYNGGHGAHAFISANGTANGIVWTLDLGTPAHLHAYNASNVSGNPIFTGSATLPGGVNCTGPKFTVPTVANGKVYFTAYDSGNQSHLFVFAQPAAAGGTPVAPSNPVATANTSSKITVTWTDNATNELGFTVRRGLTAAGPFTNLSPNPNANETSFIDTTGLNPNTTYFYQVLAFNANGNSAPSSVASDKTFPLFKPDGLVAYWNLDEGSIGAEADATGNGHTGTANGEVASSAGYLNNAISFHGTGTAISNVSVPNTADMQFTASQSFTASAWINVGSLNGIYEAIFAKSFNTGNYYGIWINPAGNWVFRGPGGDVVGTAATVSTWTHVAIVQDGAANTRKIYVNGGLVGTGAAQAADGSGPLWIGQANPGTGIGTQSFPGILDEVRLYNRALSATEITTLIGPPVLQSESREAQGAAGTFDKVIFPAPAKVLESRQGATAGSYNLILDFGAPVATGITATLGLQGGGGATGSVGTITYANSNKTLTIPLTSVANVQALNLHLINVKPTGASVNGTADIAFNSLRGDVNNDNIVSSLDVTQTTNAQGSAVSATTFQYDINCDGVINATDTSLVSSYVGTNLGAQLDFNASLGKTATASTVQGTDIANNGIDGNYSSRWTAASGTFPQWWRVDLGENHSLSRVDIAWYSSATRAYKYIIETSADDANYTTVVNKSTNTTFGDTSDAFTGSGRYVRVTVSGSTAGFASLFEVAVIGHPSSGGGPVPAITSATSASGTVGTAFSYQITATNSPTSYSATGLSGTGLSLNSSSGLISGTPSTATGSPFTIGLSATNGNGTGPTTNLTLTISPSGATPTITSSLTASGTVGTAFSYQITATNSPTSYAATGLSGTGLSLNSSSGLISGTPSTATGSPFTIGLSATNGNGTGPTANLTLTISAGGDTNLALGDSATASSFQAGNLVANGNNASTTDRWAASSAVYPQWWRVDLGASKVLSRVDIMWYSTTNRAYKYRLETSDDDANYTTAFDNTANTTFADTSNPISATARYVRVTVTGCTAGAGQASFYDLKVFGH